VNTKEYIESGILEAYTLGALTAQEAAQVEADVALYSDLRDELNVIEHAMFRLATSLAVEPPIGLHEKIWWEIKGASGSAADGKTDAANTPKIIPFQPEHRKAMDWKYAALLAVLIGSLAVNLILYNQGRQAREGQAALATQMDKLQTEQKQLAQVADDYQKAKAMMADTGMQTIVMHTMQPGHPMAATLYWSKGKGDAYVAMNALPEPPKGMQYQLWVIQKGKPVSMGMLPNAMANTPAMQKVSMQVTDGEAFAISLEKEGGNPTPTTVYVLGKA
jgi:anti-sigma-K factor RskA